MREVVAVAFVAVVVAVLAVVAGAFASSAVPVTAGLRVAVVDPQLQPVAGSLHDYLACFAMPLWSFVGTRFAVPDWVLVLAVHRVVAVTAV